MTALLTKLAVRVAVFAVTLGITVWRFPRIRVDPRWALPVVAIVFAGLNTALYFALAAVVKLVIPWLLFLIAPFIANLVLLWLTERWVKWLEIEGVWPLLQASALLTIAHIGLRLVGM